MIKGIYLSVSMGLFLLAQSSLSSASDLSSLVKILETGIEISLKEEPENGTLKLARFNNLIERVVLKQENKETKAKLKAYPKYWEITLPDVRSLKGSTVFVETVGQPLLAGKPIVVEPDDSGILTLKAHLATTVGEELRYEPQPNKNTLGYWRKPSDFPEWLFKVTKPGKYRVVVHQGCGPGQGESLAEIVVGEQSLRFKVRDTGHFQNFEARKVGTLKIESTEEQSLQVHITRLAKKAAMDLRLVELIPVN